MSKDTERASPPLHIHFGDRMLDNAARNIVDVVKRTELGEVVSPQRHLSFKGWDALAHAFHVAGLSGQTNATVIAALKGIAGEDEFPCEAPDDSASPAPWDRSALANLRQQWLHYHALGKRTIVGQRVADDLAPIVLAFEVACHEVDQLRQRVEQAEADIARLHGCLWRTSRDGSGAGTGEIDRDDSYKGYAPDIQIDPVTSTLHAVASGIADVVHAEGRTAADLWQAFRDSGTSIWPPVRKRVVNPRSRSTATPWRSCGPASRRITGPTWLIGRRMLGGGLRSCPTTASRSKAGFASLPTWT